MNIDIKSGDKTIVASGVFVTDSETNDISFKIKDVNFNCKLIFKEEKDVKGEKIRWYPKEDKTGLVIEFLNFDGILSSVSEKPHLLASIEGDDLYFIGHINAFQKNIKVVTFTFYLKEQNVK
ncbi:hypothetical protein HYY71_03740 [Candidatus Woesearchaeota archaeon]|nr:hypothetical protein [Candidatus Woesearchaeota archaeon]